MTDNQAQPRVGGASGGKIAAIALAALIAGALIGVGGKTALDRNQARHVVAPQEGMANAEQLFAEIDTDKSGSISQDELRVRIGAVQTAVRQRLEAQRKKREQVFRAQLEERFKALDKDHSGGLDNSEFDQLPAVKSDKLLVPPFAELDTSKDGALQLDEYISLVRSLLMATNKPATPPTPASQ